MLYLRMYRADIPRARHATFTVLKQRAGERLRALLGPTTETQARIVGVAPEALEQGRPPMRDVYGQSRVIDGELYTDGQAIVLMSLSETRQRAVLRPRRVEPVGGTVAASEPPPLRLDIYFIGPSSDSDAVGEILGVAQDILGVAPERYSWSSRQLNELRDEGREPPAPPSENELAAARLLRDRSVRMLTIAIKASGGLLVRDLPKQVSSDETRNIGELTELLKGARLVDSEIVVVCSKTQAQVTRAPNRDVLAELSARRIRCACGRPIADERIEEALTVTDLGRALLDKARWLTVLLVEQLEAVGVSRDDILVEQNVGGDEIDCLANISGELALFELKDKEFNLGNAYSFGAKIGIIRPAHSVIFTTEQVGNDAKEHFVRARKAGGPRDFDDESEEPGSREIVYIEGVHNLQVGVEQLTGSINRIDAARLLDEVLPLASLSGATLLQAIERGPALAAPKDARGAA